MRRKLERARDALRRGGVGGLASSLRRAAEERAAAGRRTWRALTRRTLEFGIRPHLLHGRVRHLHGQERVEYGPSDLLVICVVRNGSLHVDSFLEHYTALGAAHCVFLDNGSTDGTVERLRAHAAVTVLQTDAPYEKYENTMKRYLAERFSRGRWNLCADVDELFDYPGSDRLPLPAFLGYLDSRGFTALVAQMLDMFSDEPVATIRSQPGDRLKDRYPFFDISDIRASPYEWSTLASPAVRMHRGGIRRTVFGTDNGLTKAALVKMDGRVAPFVEWHQADGAVVADVTGVLLHYPFVGSFASKVEEAVRTGRYGAVTTDEYGAYARALARDPSLTLRRETAQRFEGLERLTAEGFLVVSDEYRRWIERHSTVGGRSDASSVP